MNKMSETKPEIEIIALTDLNNTYMQKSVNTGLAVTKFYRFC